MIEKEKTSNEQFDKKDFDDKELKKEQQRKFLKILGPVMAILLGGIKTESSEKYSKFENIPLPKSDIRIKGEMATLKESDEKAVERLVAEHEMSIDAENLYNGTCYNEKLRDLKGKLIMNQDIEGKVNNELYDSYQKIYEKGESLSGKERSDYMRDIMKATAESYSSGMKDHMEHKNLEEITATSLATIHEYNSIYRAGSIDDQVTNQEKAGLITKGNKETIKNALEKSQESIKIENLPKNVEINGKTIEISNENDLYQHIGRGMVKFPMQFLQGAEINNLYDLKKEDPKSYENYLSKYLDLYTDKTINELTTMGAKIENDDNVTRAIIREKLKESALHEGKEISFELPEKSDGNKNEFKIDTGKFELGGREYNYRLGVVETINIGQAEINIPGLEIASRLKGEKGVSVSFDLKAVGGRINARILCRGNMVKIIIPEHSAGMNEKDEKYAVNALILLVLLPLIRLPKESEKKKPKKLPPFENNPIVPITGSPFPKIEKMLINDKIGTPPPKNIPSDKIKGMYKDIPLMGLQTSREGESGFSHGKRKHRMKQGRSDTGGRIMGDRASRNREGSPMKYKSRGKNKLK